MIGIEGFCFYLNYHKENYSAQWLKNTQIVSVSRTIFIVFVQNISILNTVKSTHF